MAHVLMNFMLTFKKHDFKNLRKNCDRFFVDMAFWFHALTNAEPTFFFKNYKKIEIQLLKFDHSWFLELMV
jgi:hypothetical protein